jgi:hypothetical protein
MFRLIAESTAINVCDHNSVERRTAQVLASSCLSQEQKSAAFAGAVAGPYYQTMAELRITSIITFCTCWHCAFALRLQSHQ